MTLLLDAGGDPNRRDSRQGWTPLMHAQHAKQGSAAQLLLSRGADGASGAGGNSPMEMAALDNDVALLRTLLAANPPRDQQVRAFALAVSGGALADSDRPVGRCHTETVSLLPGLRQDPGARSHEGVGRAALVGTPPRLPRDNFPSRRRRTAATRPKKRT